MGDRTELLENFVSAALKLMENGLSGLSPENAFRVARAQEVGADIVLIFSPGAGNVVGAIHLPDSDADPVTLFKILIPSSEVSH